MTRPNSTDKLANSYSKFISRVWITNGKVAWMYLNLCSSRSPEISISSATKTSHWCDVAWRFLETRHKDDLPSEMVPQWCMLWWWLGPLAWCLQAVQRYLPTRTPPRMWWKLAAPDGCKLSDGSPGVVNGPEVSWQTRHHHLHRWHRNGFGLRPVGWVTTSTTTHTHQGHIADLWG